MVIPTLKRINIKSEQELDIWMARNASDVESVMVVTHTNTSHRKYVSREQINCVLARHGWKSKMRYNLGSNLLGHVIIRRPDANRHLSSPERI